MEKGLVKPSIIKQFDNNTITLFKTSNNPLIPLVELMEWVHLRDQCNVSMLLNRLDDKRVHSIVDLTHKKGHDVGLYTLLTLKELHQIKPCVVKSDFEKFMFCYLDTVRELKEREEC